MKKLMVVAAATVAAWYSWGAERISVREVANHYPWDGKVDCIFTLRGMENWRSYEGVFQLSVKKDGEAHYRAVTNAVANVDGVYTNTFDCSALFGAGYYPNGGIAVELVKKIDGVQLWENGPYFATCNVGAARPEEAGYYFWWGDTIGYKRNAANTGWNASDGEAVGFQFSSTNAQIVTYNKSKNQLTSAGYSGSNGELDAQYDAATMHLGAPWRMPTNAEIQALWDYCSTTWTNNWNGTGVNGWLVTGMGDYASKSIFLPAAGYGYGSYLNNAGSGGRYWSSTPYSDNSNDAWYLYFSSGSFGRSNFYYRYSGQSVRPLRGFAE